MIRETRLAAKILVQQAEQQVVLPDPVDAEIAPRQALAGKPAFLQHPDRGRVGGNAGGLDAVQIEFAEQRRQQHAQRRRHVAAMRMGPRFAGCCPSKYPMVPACTMPRRTFASVTPPTIAPSDSRNTMNG